MLGFLRELRQITSTSRGSTRIAYTDSECDAHDLAWKHLSDVPGLQRVADAAGNTFIAPKESFGSHGKPVLLVGSHLDTVVEGGWLDGSLGVAAGLHAVRHGVDDGTPHPNLGVVIFRDEEGVRFRNGLFGSRVFAGCCRAADLDVVDQTGVSLRSVVPDPEGCLDYRPPVAVAGFLECHIEQGLRLEDRAARVGVVTGIVGIRRYLVSASGVANHAGTTEMDRRRDALIPMCQFVAELPALVNDQGDAVITCGSFNVHPGAPNIVPGRVDAVVEARAQSSDMLDTIERRVLKRVRDAQVSAKEKGVDVTWSRVADIAPVETNAKMLQRLRAILDHRHITHTDLPSMAGHDAQHAARICPSAMFFVPSIDGVSHNPDENSREEDIALAGDVMFAWAMESIDALGLG